MSTVPIHYCCYLCLFDDTLSTYLHVENSFSFFLLTPNVKSLAWFARTLVHHHFIQSNSNYYHHTKMLSHRLENLYASSVLTSNVFYLVTLNIGSRACLGDLKKIGRFCPVFATSPPTRKTGESSFLIYSVRLHHKIFKRL